MKKYLLLAFASIFVAITNSAQTTIKLKMNHKLGSSTFTKNTKATNSKGEEYTITRLEYYLSNIIVIHDNGIMDTFNGKYLLIDPSKDTGEIELGIKTLTNIEAIQFSIGVDKDANHKDPSKYAPFDPLAPKSPSMHWGWGPGYRFIAIEGKSGSSLNLIYELHGLGDGNYFSVRIPVTATTSNNVKVIELNADYNEVLRNISVKSGVVAHGNDAEDKVALENMRDHVFTSTTGKGNILKIKDIEVKPSFGVYPNPVKTGDIITIDFLDDKTTIYQVYNLSGKLVKIVSSAESTLQLAEQGVYQLVAVDSEGNSIASQKIIVQ